MRRIPGGSLTDIQFLDFETGWISGHILHPDARDPFFLISSDGGKSWRRRPVYSEPKTGSIERFRFTSKTSGQMMIDRGQAGENGLRYELWESLTGGESWNVRQVDTKPMPFPEGDPGPKPLRIRADAASKTYRIEQQEGSTVAIPGFLRRVSWPVSSLRRPKSRKIAAARSRNPTCRARKARRAASES